jgi:hypothetical protein
VSTTPVRHAQAAAQAAAAQAAAEARRPEARTQHAHHGAGQRGQFGSYVFRLGRAPAPPPPRRPVPLRRRPPHPPGVDHDPEHGVALNMPLLGQSSAIDDDERAAAMDFDAMGTHDQPDEGMHEHESRQRQQHAMQWRLGARAQPDAGARALLPALQAACGADAQALWAPPAPTAPVRAGELARALVGALLATNMPGAASLQMAAVRAYLVKGQESGGEGGALATLERVKQVLLEGRPAGAKPQGLALPDEAQQNRNLLLPLKLLNADRPRTAEQAQQACSRIELSCRTLLMSGMAAPSA